MDASSRKEYEQNEKRITDQINKWENWSKDAMRSINSYKEVQASNELEIELTRASLLGHDKMREALVETIHIIERRRYSPSNESLDQLIARAEANLLQDTHEGIENDFSVERESYNPIRDLIADHSSEA